jgi:hypothetical protein
VFGVAVLASVFSSHGSYASGHAFVSGIVPALWVGVAVLGAFALLVAIAPWQSRATAPAHASGSETQPRP